MRPGQIAFPSSLPPSGGTEPHLCQAPHQRPCAAETRQSFKLERKPVNRHKLQGELLEPRLIMKSSLVSKLIECDEIDLAGKIDRCHTTKMVKVCKNCARVSTYWNHCNNFLCPVCAAALSAQRRLSIQWWASQIQQPKHVVVTVKSFPTLTQARVRWIRQCWNQLRRTTLAKEWSGGCYSLECTHSAEGWHLHIHALIDCRWIDSRLLSAKWFQVTGGAGYIVKVKDVREKSYLAEICKYAAKPVDLVSLNAFELWQFIGAFSGLKQFTVFGTLRGSRQAWRAELERRKLDHNTCECGCTEYRFMTEEEFEAWSISQEIKFAPRPPPGPAVIEPDSYFLPGLDVIYEG